MKARNGVAFDHGWSYLESKKIRERLWFKQKGGMYPCCGSNNLSMGMADTVRKWAYKTDEMKECY